MLLFLSTPPVSRMVPSSSVVAASRMREDTMLVGHCPLTGVPTHEKVPESGVIAFGRRDSHTRSSGNAITSGNQHLPGIGSSRQKIGRLQMTVGFHRCVGRGERWRVTEGQDLGGNVVLRATCDENDVVVRVRTDLICHASRSART